MISVICIWVSVMIIYFSIPATEKYSTAMYYFWDKHTCRSDIFVARGVAAWFTNWVTNDTDFVLEQYRLHWTWTFGAKIIRFYFLINKQVWKCASWKFKSTLNSYQTAAGQISRERLVECWGSCFWSAAAALVRIAERIHSAKPNHGVEIFKTNLCDSVLYFLYFG